MLALAPGLWYARLSAWRAQEGAIDVIRMRAGLTLISIAALLAAGALTTSALADTAATTTTLGPTGTTGAGGTTSAEDPGAQQAATCATPQLKGLPKKPKFTNATINFALTNMTPGSTFILSAGNIEVYGSTVNQSTFKDKFQLPDQGRQDRNIMITAIVDANCTNAPWKLQKRIKYDAVTPPAAPPVAPPAGAPVTGTAAPAPGAPVPTPAPVKPLKLPKPITKRLPRTGPPPSQLAWMTPVDGAARVDRLAGPALGRLERKVEKAQSTNALFGLGIVVALFALIGFGGFVLFRHRDDTEFERAMTEQLKHLEEGDPGLESAEDPMADPLTTSEEAPFADHTEDPTEPLHANGAPVAAAPANGEPHSPEQLAAHRAAVEAELERILSEAGVQAELEGILVDARNEAERQGIAIDPDLMLQTLCEEINGSARLSDPKRAELLNVFSSIIAEEAQQEAHAAPAEAEKVPQ
jgi:hypothetical protein